MINKGYAYVGNWYSQGLTMANNPTTWNSAANGSGVTAVAADFTTAGNTWNVQNSVSMNGTWTVAGDIVITPTGTLSPGVFSITLGGNWTNNGTFTAGTGTVVFNGTTTGYTLNGSMTGSNKFNNITFNGSGGAWTFGANAADVSANFTITLGTVTAPSTTLNVGGNFVHTAGTFTHNSGTVVFNGSGAQAIPTTATTFNNLTVSNTAGTITANAAITINGTLSSSAGANLNMVTNQLLGTMSPSAFLGTLQTQCVSNPPVPNGLTWGGTVTYNSTTTNMNVASGTYNNLTISGTSGSRTINGALTVNGNFNVGTAATTTGVTTLGGNLAVAGNITIGSSTTAFIFDVSTNNYQISVGGNWSLYSSVATNPINGRSGLVIFNGTGSQTITTTGGTGLPGFYDLENSNTSNTLTVAKSINVGHNLTNDLNATLSPGANTLTVGGNWANNGTFTAGTSTVIMSAVTNGKTLSGNMTGSNMFNNITFSGGGGSWSFGTNAADAGGNFTVSLGTVTAPSTTLKVAGNFVHNGGTFTHNNGTLELNGTGVQTIPSTAVTTFYNLNISNTGGTVSANGPFTVNGTLASSAGAVLNMVTSQLTGTLSASTFNGTLQTQCTSNPPVPNGVTWGGQ